MVNLGPHDGQAAGPKRGEENLEINQIRRTSSARRTGAGSDVHGKWVTIHKAATVYTRIQTNTHSLLRELSGPRPFRRVVDIVSKPRIWSRGAKAISLENRPTLQVTGSGRIGISSASTVPHAGPHLDTRLFNPTGVREVEVLEN